MGGLYSSDRHDRKNRKKAGKKSAAPKSTTPSGSFSNHTFLTDQDRSRLRKAQLGDQDLEGFKRREYKLQDGSTSYSEPRVLPPRHDLRKPQVLENDPDLQADTESAEPTDRIAALGSDKEEALSKMDRMLTEAVSHAHNLAEACKELHRQLEREGTDEEKHYAETNVWIMSDALLPWLTELDRNFDEILRAEPVE